jgi:hypothetical protein
MPFLPRRRSALCILSLLAGAAASPAQITTSQVNNDRTGANLRETILTPRNVNSRQFGKLFTLPVDGDVYAQPLFVPGVEIPGHGRHDVLYIATEHDTVYAFDAYTPAAPLWQTSLLKEGETPVAEEDVQCFFIRPDIGITSTPVIDLKTGTLYVLARTRRRNVVSSNDFHQRLHALAITTGVEKFAGPVEIHASVPGRGDGSRNGQVAFDPLRENPRAALLLANNAVYLSWASSCDVGPYHGWIMAYNAQTLEQRAVLNVSPDADDSGIWASDTGLAADSSGFVYAATGNGRFDVSKGGRDYGDTLLKLNGNDLSIADYFTPFDADQLNADDNDLGSGGPMLLPNQPHAPAHVALIGGKAPTLYLVNLDRMGHFQTGSDSHAIQTLPTKGGIYGSSAYWNHTVYVLADSDALRAYDMVNGRLVHKAASTFTLRDHAATPTVSANGNKDGIVWVVSSKSWNGAPRPAVLHAVDASDVTRELYNSDQNSARDRAAVGMRFNIPTIANGHVYIGARREVDVYGELPAPH